MLTFILRVLELVKKCRYDEGYVLQKVFSCKTCYMNKQEEEQGINSDFSEFLTKYPET